jgi:FMN-dependent oxidoreductase (nitrilotriacetate monooxygenase family)
MAERKMKFVTLMCAGPTNHNNGGWRHPDGDGHLVLDPARYEEIARVSEQGLFDGIFFVDYQFIQGHSKDKPNRTIEHGGQMVMLDPLQICACMARVTKHIGVTATLSTSLHKPYHIARTFASLDHISHGRAGWNVVTSGNPLEALNFGMDSLALRGDRYDYADEVLEACTALWNTWEPDALKFDKASGYFADPSKVHWVKYQGEHVRTEGGLTTPTPPQGSPVLMQAGSSDRGRRFAARWAEVVFTLQNDKAKGQAFYAEMKDRVRAAGRPAHHCAILPAIDIIVGATEAEARAESEYVDSLASPELGIQTLTDLTGVDMFALPRDMLLADVAVDPERAVSIGIYQNALNARTKDGRQLTIGEAGQLYAATWMSPRLVGTPAEIVDMMEDRFHSGVCDGFVLGTSTMPVGLKNIVRLVVPELQRRGLYRTEYEGRTFRENIRA